MYYVSFMGNYVGQLIEKSVSNIIMENCIGFNINIV